MAVRSFRSVVQEVDPNWQQEQSRDVSYAFGNGRTFIDRQSSAGFAAKWNGIADIWDRWSQPWGS